MLLVVGVSSTALEEAQLFVLFLHIDAQFLIQHTPLMVSSLLHHDHLREWKTLLTNVEQVSRFNMDMNKGVCTCINNPPQPISHPSIQISIPSFNAPTCHWKIPWHHLFIRGHFYNEKSIPWQLRFQIPSFLLVPYALVRIKTIYKRPSEDAWMNGTSKCSSTTIFEQALVSLGNSKVAWPLVLLCGCAGHHQHQILPSTTSHLVVIRPSTTHRKVAVSHRQRGLSFMLASSRSHPFIFIYLSNFTLVWYQSWKKLVCASREFNQVRPNMPLDARILAMKDRKAQDVEIMRTLSMVLYKTLWW